ncbi:hypothetical protein DVQ29_14565 [Yersinia enterocolitica]|nr:hypothetical protein [Yersinia enterocolitica]
MFLKINYLKNHVSYHRKIYIISCGVDTHTSSGDNHSINTAGRQKYDRKLKLNRALKSANNQTRHSANDAMGIVWNLRRLNER